MGPYVGRVPPIRIHGGPANVFRQDQQLINTSAHARTGHAPDAVQGRALGMSLRAGDAHCRGCGSLGTPPLRSGHAGLALTPRCGSVLLHGGSTLGQPRVAVGAADGNCLHSARTARAGPPQGGRHYRTRSDSARDREAGAGPPTCARSLRCARRVRHLHAHTGGSTTDVLRRDVCRSVVLAATSRPWPRARAVAVTAMFCCVGQPAWRLDCRRRSAGRVDGRRRLAPVEPPEDVTAWRHRRCHGRGDPDQPVRLWPLAVSCRDRRPAAAGYYGLEAFTAAFGRNPRH
jgi:hypothetical protein